MSDTGIKFLINYLNPLWKAVILMEKLSKTVLQTL